MEAEQIIQKEINRLRREKESGEEDVIESISTSLALSHIAKKHKIDFLLYHKQIERIYN